MNPTYFTYAVHMVLIEEGPMSNDGATSDPNGGLTRFGISQIQNPALNVASLTQQQAIDYYHANYWTPNNLDALPWPLSYVIFDIDVNNGDRIGARLLQRALGLQDDGQVGPHTINAAHAVRDPLDLCMRVLAKRGVYYTTLSNWTPNAEGWMYRNACVAKNCLRYAA